MNETQATYLGLFEKYIEEHKIALEPVSQCRCGSSAARTVANKDRFGLAFRLVECETCGLLYTTPRLAQNSLALYYDEIYHPLVFGTESIKESLVSEEQGRLIFDFISPVLKSRNELRILDIGCGNGDIMETLGSMFGAIGVKNTLCGIEYSEAYVCAAARRRLEVIKGGLDDLGKFKGKFDLIILSHVLEHFADIDNDFEKILKCLKNDGFIYVEVPGLFSLIGENRYRYDIGDFFVHAHNFHFHLDTLNSFCASHGLSLIKGNERVQALFGLEIADGPAGSLIEKYSFSNFLRDLASVKKASDDLNQALAERNETIHKLRDGIERKDRLLEEKSGIIEEKNVLIERLRIRQDGLGDQLSEYQNFSQTTIGKVVFRLFQPDKRNR